jgi:hypothetical protein
MCSVRAVVLDRPGEPVRVTDVPDPVPALGQLRIRVSDMSEIPAFGDEDLRHERTIRSVANLTRDLTAATSSPSPHRFRSTRR